MRSQPVLTASSTSTRLPSRLALVAGATSVLVHGGLAMLVLTHGLVPEIPPSAGVTVSIEGAAPATNLAEDAPSLRPAETLKDDHPLTAAAPDAASREVKPDVQPGVSPAAPPELPPTPSQDAGPAPAATAGAETLPQAALPLSPAVAAEPVRPEHEASGLDATPAPAAIDPVTPVPKDSALPATVDDTPAAMPDAVAPSSPPSPEALSSVITAAPIEPIPDGVPTAPAPAVPSPNQPAIPPETKGLDAAPVQPAAPTLEKPPEAMSQAAAEPVDAPKQGAIEALPLTASAPAPTAWASIEAPAPFPLSPPAPRAEASPSIVKPSGVEAVREGGAALAPPIADLPLQSSPPSVAPQAAEVSTVPEQHAATGPASRPTAVAMLAAPHAIGEMIGFIRRYDGGSCFFVSPAKITTESADIDSFSDSADRIKTFNDAFFADMGLDPDVAGQRVSKAQCPVVDFLKAVRGGDTMEAPALHVDHRYLRSGDIVSGGIEGFGERHLTLLLVSETGAVDNVTTRLSRVGDVTTFSLPLRHEREGGPFPQMLVAIGSQGLLPEAALPTSIRDGAFHSLVEAASHDPQALRAASTLIFVSH